jgi:hypothetical protein
MTFEDVSSGEFNAERAACDVIGAASALCRCAPPYVRDLPGLATYRCRHTLDAVVSQQHGIYGCLSSVNNGALYDTRRCMLAHLLFMRVRPRMRLTRCWYTAIDLRTVAMLHSNSVLHLPVCFHNHGSGDCDCVRKQRRVRGWI